jgi:predicted secreted protein
MATDNKDFKVKNGLAVANGGIFGGTVTVAAPTQNTHAATKQYVDEKEIFVATESSAPDSAVNGQLYIDTTTNRLAFYVNGVWHTLTTFNDIQDIPQHIHDTAIDGTGFIVSQYQDAGFYNDASGTPVDAGNYNTNSWTVTWDGGLITDAFN